jgi:hypothetical protein
MATFIYLDNYRGFTNSLTTIAQVNWLVGENSTGKTSFLEILNEMSFAPFWIFEPRLGMNDAHKRHFLDLVSAASKSKKIFTVGALEINPEENKPNCGMIISYVNHEGRPVPKRISILDGPRLKTIDGPLWLYRKGEHYCSKICALNQSELADVSSKTASFYVKYHKINRGFLPFEVNEAKTESSIFDRFSDILFNGLNYGERINQVPDFFKINLVDLAPIRIKPRRTYDAPQTSFSSDGEHTPYVIRKRLSNKTLAVRFRDFLEQCGKDSGLFESIKIKKYGSDTRSPFEIQILLGKASLGLENVGYGVSQALPLFVEIFIRRKGSGFIIQQPEVHLHPRAQASFGGVVADMAREEKKVFFIETHSDFSIDRFRLNIKNNSPLDAQILYFERTLSGNTAVSITIDDKGELSESQTQAYRNFFINESLALLEN